MVHNTKWSLYNYCFSLILLNHMVIFQSPRQAAWVDARQRALLTAFKQRPSRPSNCLRSLCFKIAESTLFFNFVTTVSLNLINIYKQTYILLLYGNWRHWLIFIYPAGYCFEYYHDDNGTFWSVGWVVGRARNLWLYVLRCLHFRSVD